MSKFHEQVYTYAMYISYILYVVVLLGLSYTAPQYLDLLRDFIKIYISLILIIKFNPLVQKNKIMTEFDKQIVFSSGVFLLLTTSITSLVERYLLDIIDKTPLNKFQMGSRVNI